MHAGFSYSSRVFCAQLRLYRSSPGPGDDVNRDRDRTGEAEAGGDAGHGGGDEVVQVPVRRRRQLQRPEADVVQRLVVDTVRFVCVLDQLVDGQRGVVGFNNCVGDLKHNIQCCCVRYFRSVKLLQYFMPPSNDQFGACTYTANQGLNSKQ